MYLSNSALVVALTVNDLAALVRISSCGAQDPAICIEKPLSQTVRKTD